jgi:hypothetical protein
VDWNEDGLKDLIVGEYNGKVRYYRNIGTATVPALHFEGYLQCLGADIDCGDYSTPFINDWNQDGAKDLLIGDSNGLFYLFINEGTNAVPVFNEFTNINIFNGSLADVGNRSGPNVVDLDGDGLKDLVSGDMTGKVYFFKNIGTNAVPVLEQMVALLNGTQQIQLTSTSRVTTIDWDNNGQLDMVVGNYDAILQRFMRSTTITLVPICDIVNTGNIALPAAGGYLRYNLIANNLNTSPVNFDAWTEMKMPNNTMVPQILRPGMTLAGGGNITRAIVQNIPATSPAGFYYLYFYVGNHTTLQIYDSDYMYFLKSTTDEGGAVVDNWDIREEEVTSELPINITSSFKLNSPSPNPFNPETSISFTLNEASAVELAVFDVKGREVAVLEEGYLNAGSYERTFNGSDLPSGMYFVHLRVGIEVQTAKMLLMK